MHTKIKFLVTLSACMAMVLAVFGISARAAETSKGRPEISAAERALDMLEIQNTFSKHAYYHQAGKHCEELRDIWVSRNGPYAKTATWILAGQLQQGMKMIWHDYCTVHLNSEKQTLKELSKKVPSLKDIPANIGAGAEYVMHTQETPVIEVAGDGKTAKGLWYSIGLAVHGSVGKNGKTTVSTNWMWEKYGIDFVKENGKWKIWHFLNLMDQTPVEAGAKAQGGPGGPGGPGGAPGGKAGAPGGQGPGGPGGMINAGKSPRNDFRWTPTAVLRIDPKIPQPYYTFSETFSY